MGHPTREIKARSGRWRGQLRLKAMVIFSTFGVVIPMGQELGPPLIIQGETDLVLATELPHRLVQQGAPEEGVMEADSSHPGIAVPVPVDAELLEVGIAPSALSCLFPGPI